MASRREGIGLIQQGLSLEGYDPGGEDGIWGPKTLGAIDALRRNGGAAVPQTGWAAKDLLDPPWITEAKTVLGLHETRDNAALKAWLRSDGKTLGDPKALPWCGDFTETAIKNSLPAEPFSGALGANPYWARNWALFGTACEPCYGCVLVFERSGGGGHVAFAVGQDDAYFFCLGGNQNNAVNVSRIAKSRLLASRWPATATPATPRTPLPRMTAGAAGITTNEV
ncbi:NlpC/P60 family protein [Gemmobacter lutimaris]|uniref:NlpC/P60 family protein n=1 Tax=Gemmobacter lutimaris TaxID=2306023 RepID=UPI0018F50D6C|nr:peptidoglycan-binding protein [Gemmobacter lutimaris]